MASTETKRVKAIEAANRRLKANQDAVQAAYARDLRDGPEQKQQKQWQAGCLWVRSEAKQLSDEQRSAYLAELISLAQRMNASTRIVE